MKSIPSLTTLFSYTFAVAALALTNCSSSQTRPPLNEPNGDAGDSGLVDRDSSGWSLDDSGGRSDVSILDDLLNSGCATARGETNRKPAYVLMVVDASGSMAFNGKWVALQGTTSEPGVLPVLFDEYQKRNDFSFALGMEIFSGQVTQLLDISKAGIPKDWNCDTDNPLDESKPNNCVHRVVGPNQINQVWKNKKTLYEYLKLYVQNTKPEGSTPIYDALNVAYKKMQSFVPATPLAPEGDRYVVFLTDGRPEGPGGGMESDIKTLTQTANSGPTPIRTFVMGVGRSIGSNDYNAPLLGQLATLGGTAKPNCNPNETSDASKACFFTINTSMNTTPTKEELDVLRKQFVDAFEKIQGGVLSCSYKLQIDPNRPIDPTKTNVIYKDGTGKEQVIVSDPTNGWSFDNPTSPTQVNLNGESCRQLKTDPQGKIYIILGCKTYVH